ncbi:MAG: fatty acid desaturase [Sphingobacteriales bacterium]|nr:MAG: fatty acid desaturase [Sphingobacteriales bacterium]
MTGRELILATKPFAKEDRGKSWMYLLSSLFLLAAALAGSFFMPFLLFKVVCSVLAGLLLVRMFIIYHDFQHHAILHRSVLADVIMSLYGLYVLAPASIWKRSHDHHHNHNSKLFSASIGSYPIATKANFLSMPAGERRMYLFVRHPLTILMGYFTMFIFGMCISSFISSPKRHYDSAIALVLHGVIIYFGVTLFGWQALLLTYFLPLFMACAMGAYLFYAQHNFPATSFGCKEEWKYEMAALESSSYMVMGPFMNFMTGNIGYHHIHHLNSRIPFYRLPEAMEAIPQLQAARKTSLDPKEIAACLRLKVWDPEANKMVGFKELGIA